MIFYSVLMLFLSKRGEKMNRKKLTKIIIIFVCTFLVVLGAGYAYLNSKYMKMYQERTKENERITSSEGEKEGSSLDSSKTIEGSINILLLGTDDGGMRTDVCMLIHYDTYTKSTSLFSVPRDYMITLSESAQEKLQYYAPIIKFTEIMAYAKDAGLPSPSSYITQIVEELLNVKIDHFVLVDLRAFRSAVDSIGGVEVYVPQRMHWIDPVQNLYIDLEPGLQLLNGEQAEGMVRFRQGYDGNDYGDYGRMEVQQYFLTAYVKKLFRVENLTKIDQIIEPLSKLINTDASLADAFVLLNTTKEADFSRVNAHTLPGYDNMIDEKYFYTPPAPEELKRFFLEQIVNDTTVDYKSSKDYKIEVYSAQYDMTTAEEISKKLSEDGYTTEFMGLDPGPRTLKSVIIVPEAGLGLDLKKYLEISEVVVDEELTQVLETKTEDVDTEGSQQETENKPSPTQKGKILLIVGEVQQKN